MGNFEGLWGYGKDVFDECVEWREGLERIEENSAIKLYIGGQPRRIVA